jgi:deoxyribodipyrimidine photo-lyase
MKNIDSSRVHCLREAKDKEKGNYVLYWMSLAFRSDWNYSLEYAVGIAEKHDAKVLVMVSLPDHPYPYTERHLTFLLQGIQDTQQQLASRNVKLIVRLGNISEHIKELSKDAIALVTDFPYLKEDKERLEKALYACSLPVFALESNVTVPVEAITSKQEYAARTIRPKLMEAYEGFLTKPRESKLPKSSMNMSVDSVDVSKPQQLINSMQFSEHAEPVKGYTGGASEARKMLDKFLDTALSDYENQRQSPTEPAVSYLSMYLSFGMIAPAYILNRLQKRRKSKNVQSFIEELLVRRELAYNFVHFTKDYDSLSALPNWAKESLEKHKDDPREEQYTRNELEKAATHDEAWNECMKRMKENGYLHNHMRMYWGKQILAWSNTPNYAHKTLLYLNNKYFLDGNDPNSYSNALWVFGLHDRAWQENEVFGKVRKMNRNGLDRKIDVERFVQS